MGPYWVHLYLFTCVLTPTVYSPGAGQEGQELVLVEFPRASSSAVPVADKGKAKMET